MVKTTAYFEGTVLIERPYLRREWCERVRVDAEERNTQPDGRIQHWGRVPEMAEALAERSGKSPEESTDYLRVVTLDDGETIHNAMPDRNYARRKRR